LADQSFVKGLSLLEGKNVKTNSSGEAEMVIGFTEAQMMREEGLFKRIGDSLTDFFGLPSVKIVGILSPTNSLLDESHILNDL
jgi:hypothetical protein